MVYRAQKSCRGFPTVSLEKKKTVTDGGIGREVDCRGRRNERIAGKSKEVKTKCDQEEAERKKKEKNRGGTG